MQRDAIQYHILIIRLWPEQADQAASRWRITLESPASEGRQGFTELRALLDKVEETLTTLMHEHGSPDRHVSAPPPIDE